MIIPVIDFLRPYLLPLILALVGLVFIAVGFISLVKSGQPKNDIEFSTSSTSSANLTLLVDIEGAVQNPGVYQLPFGARMIDALTLAGGLSGDADTNWVSQGFNKAAKLIDGAKMYIPRTGENTKQAVAGAQTVSGNKLIGINSSAKSQLEGLPGVGPVTADKIIAGRPYQTLDELTQKKIIGKALFEKIKDLIAVY